MNSDQAVAAWLQIVRALGDTIRDLGRVPAGELYAVSMASLTLEQFNRVIAILKGAGLVSEKNHELIWIGAAEEVNDEFGARAPFSNRGEWS